MLSHNKATASRNGKHAYLLTGLLHCAQCVHSYTGHLRDTKDGPIYLYACSAQTRTLAERQAINCHNPSVHCDVLNEAVWAIVCNVLLQPEVMSAALQRAYRDDQNTERQAQVAHLEQCLKEHEQEDEKLYRAFMAGAFDETEFAERRQALKAQMHIQAAERDRLKALVLKPEDLEARRRLIMEAAEHAAQADLAQAPFIVRKRVIKIIIDGIVANVTEGWFDIEGAIRGRFDIDNSSGYRPL